jgi:hypothetical protein
MPRTASAGVFFIRFRHPAPRLPPDGRSSASPRGPYSQLSRASRPGRQYSRLWRLDRTNKNGNCVTTELILHFKDGSSHEETAVFSQRRTFQLLTYQLLQKGRAFNLSTQQTCPRTPPQDRSPFTTPTMMIRKDHPRPPQTPRGPRKRSRYYFAERR